MTILAGVAATKVTPIITPAPTPATVTDDEWYYNVPFQIDATGESDGTGYLTDESRFARTLTLNGGMGITSEKFVFDGTDDYIYHDNTNQAAFTPGHRTSWELFGVEFDSLTGTRVLLANYRADNGGHGWRIYYDATAGGLRVEFGETNSATMYIGLFYAWTPKTDGTAYDIMVTWDRARVRLYIDGVMVGYGGYSGNAARTTNVGISVGCDFGTSNTARFFFQGKIKAVRITNGRDRAAGSMTTYTRHALPLTKTQATLNDALWADVIFLLHGEGENGSTQFRDRSPYDRAMVLNGTTSAVPKADTATSVGNTPSILFGADNLGVFGDYGPELDIDISTPDFCFEAFGRCTLFTGVINQVLGRRRNSANYLWQFNGANMEFYTFNGSTGTLRANLAHGMSINTVHHMCLIRSGTTYYFFKDGVLQASATDVAGGSMTTDTQQIYVGEIESNQSSRFWRGHLNWIRMTRGATRYNLAGFTAPTAPLAIR